MKSQFATGRAPKPSRPITEPLPSKPLVPSESIAVSSQVLILSHLLDSSISRVQSAPVKLDMVDVVRPVAAGVREEPIKPSGGLAAVK